MKQIRWRTASRPRPRRVKIHRHRTPTEKLPGPGYFRKPEILSLGAETLKILLAAPDFCRPFWKLTFHVSTNAYLLRKTDVLHFQIQASEPEHVTQVAVVG